MNTNKTVLDDERDIAYASFRKRWGALRGADKSDAGEPTTVEVWHACWDAAMDMAARALRSWESQTQSDERKH